MRKARKLYEKNEKQKLIEKLREQGEEDEFMEQVEMEEEKMRLKGQNEHTHFEGYCDDWDSNTHEDVHEAWCPTCNDDITDG